VQQNVPGTCQKSPTTEKIYQTCTTQNSVVAQFRTVLNEYKPARTEPSVPKHRSAELNISRILLFKDMFSMIVHKIGLLAKYDERAYRQHCMCMLPPAGNS